SRAFGGGLPLFVLAARCAGLAPVNRLVRVQQHAGRLFQVTGDPVEDRFAGLAGVGVGVGLEERRHPRGEKPARFVAADGPRAVVDAAGQFVDVGVEVGGFAGVGGAAEHAVWVLLQVDHGGGAVDQAADHQVVVDAAGAVVLGRVERLSEDVPSRDDHFGLTGIFAGQHLDGAGPQPQPEFDTRHALDGRHVAGHVSGLVDVGVGAERQRQRKPTGEPAFAVDPLLAVVQRAVDVHALDPGRNQYVFPAVAALLGLLGAAGGYHLFAGLGLTPAHQPVQRDGCCRGHGER